jgi:hypothetical protein
MIEYQDDSYRDDRMYVVNIARGTVTKGSEKTVRWVMATYRNTIRLPATRSDHFESREKAIEYLKEVEPTVPLICNEGKPLQIPDGTNRWEFWLKWLDENGLQSAITGQQHVPDWVREQGKTPSQNDIYLDVVELTEDEMP